MTRLLFLLPTLALPAFLAIAAAQDEKDDPFKARFRAEQAGNTVTLIAEGTNRTGGWKTELVAIDKTDPPAFKFKRTPPKGFATQALVRFSVKASVEVKGPTPKVVVSEGERSTTVDVKQK